METKEKSRSTEIEWTDHTWNPFVGCSMLSAGCQNCYAMRTAEWLSRMGNNTYKGLTKRVNNKVVWTGQIRLNSKTAIWKPDQISEPSIFFVNSMSDFFHDNATDEMRLLAIEVMMKCHRHQFQILTKRPENVAKFVKRTGIECFPENVWLGATVEGPLVIDRIKYVKAFPSRIKFLSIEPMIGKIPGSVSFKGLDWVISGGESGPGARPCDHSWIRELDKYLKRDGIPHFFKQWGAWQNNPISFKYDDRAKAEAAVARLDPIGKGGSLLDGVYIKQMPENFQVAKYKKIDKPKGL